MDTSAADIERTMKQSRELQDKADALVREYDSSLELSRELQDKADALMRRPGASRLDLDQVTAACQVELGRLAEILKSPKATAEIGEECHEAASEFLASCQELEKLLADVAGAPAPAARA
jgi:hypothetical protein